MKKRDEIVYHKRLITLLGGNLKRINTRHPNDHSPYIRITNIDFQLLLKLYLEEFSPYIQSTYSHLTFTEVDGIEITDHTLNIRSYLFTKYPTFNNYNDLYARLNRKSITAEEYLQLTEQLRTNIEQTVRQKFEKAILYTSTLKRTLQPHIETLLFVFIYFYNTYWDEFGMTFNGPIAYTALKELEIEQQPFSYRAAQQGKVVSGLLHEYYKKVKPPSNLAISLGSKSYDVTDTALIKWLITAMEDSLEQQRYPSSMGIYGEAMRAILKDRITSKRKIFLNNLAVISKGEAETYADAKRKVLKEFCLALHKVFSYYMGLSVKDFDGGRVKIYHNLLKAFHLANFDKTVRNTVQNIDLNSTNRKHAGDNRLGELLRRA